MSPRYLMLCASLVMSVGPVSRAVAADAPTPFVRMAEIEIDPARLAQFIAAADEEIKASVRVEPGVLALYAVSLKDNPSHVRVFEMYRDPAAYAAHLQTPHFLKFKAETQDMVKGLKLYDTTPITLAAKPGS